MMAEKMVRTQVYLPRAIYDELQRRAKDHGLTLAIQIREALGDYLAWVKDEKKVPPFNPTKLFNIIDNLTGGGPEDLAENHDKYLYSDPHGEKNLERKRPRSHPPRNSDLMIREKRTKYRTKKRGASRQASKRK
jgi:hypothetical protein